MKLEIIYNCRKVKVFFVTSGITVMLPRTFPLLICSYISVVLLRYIYGYTFVDKLYVAV